MAGLSTPRHLPWRLCAQAKSPGSLWKPALNPSTISSSPIPSSQGQADKATRLCVCVCGVFSARSPLPSPSPWQTTQTASLTANISASVPPCRMPSDRANQLPPKYSRSTVCPFRCVKTRKLLKGRFPAGRKNDYKSNNNLARLLFASSASISPSCW